MRRAVFSARRRIACVTAAAWCAAQRASRSSALVCGISTYNGGIETIFCVTTEYLTWAYCSGAPLPLKEREKKKKERRKEEEEKRKRRRRRHNVKLLVNILHAARYVQKARSKRPLYWQRAATQGMRVAASRAVLAALFCSRIAGAAARISA